MSLIGVALSAGFAGAQPDEGAVMYRRVLAPLDRPDAWPNLGEATVPVDSEQLAELLSVAPQAARQVTPAVATRLELAATLEGDELSGRGRLQVTRSAKRVSFLPWPNQAMRITGAAWADKADSAVLGVWGGGGDAEQGLLVDRDGELGFQFRCRGTQVSAGLQEYVIETPASLYCYLMLDLPAGVAPTIDNAASNTSAVAADDVLDAAAAATKGKRYRLQLTPGARHVLRLTRTGEGPSAQVPRFSVSEEVTTRVTASGLETECRYRLRTQSSLPRSVVISLDDDTHLLEASFNGEPRNWQGDFEAPGGKRLRVPLGKSDAIAEGELTIRCYSPLSESGPTTLPAPALANGEWLEGRIAVELDRSVTLRDIPRVDNALLVAEASGAYKLRFQAAAASPRIELRLEVAVPESAPAVGDLGVEQPVEENGAATDAGEQAETATSAQVTHRVTLRRQEDTWWYRCETDLTNIASATGPGSVEFLPPLPRRAQLSVGGADDSEAGELSDDNGAPTVASVKLPWAPRAAQSLVVEFTAPANQPLQAPLPSVANEPAQRGVISLEGLGGGRVSLDAGNLKPTDVSDHVGEDDGICYEYSPYRLDDNATYLTLLPMEDVLPLQRAVLTTVTTQLQPEGQIVHILRLTPPPFPAPVRFTAPANCQIMSVRDLSGAPLVNQQVSSGDAYTVQPRPDTQGIQVRLLEEQRWSSDLLITAPAPPEIERPDWLWTIVGPAGLAVESSPGASFTGGDWVHRVVAPLVEVSSSPFNPFSPESWRQQSITAAQSKSVSAATSGVDARVLVGWREHSFRFSDATRPTLRIRDQSTRNRTLLWTGLAVLLVAPWLWARSRRFTLSAALLCMIAAVVLPQSFGVFAVVCCVGLLVGGTVHPILASLDHCFSRRTGVGTVAGSVLLAALTAHVAPALGQVAVPSGAASIETVIIPVDTAGQPAGDKWYVRQSLLERLVRLRRETVRSTPTDWALVSQQLVGRLPEGGREGSVAEDWTLQCRLWTATRNVSVELPVERDQAVWEGRCLVDGIATSIDWAAEGRSCRFVVSEPGFHQVELRLAPRVVLEAGKAVIRLGIPRCSDAEFLLGGASRENSLLVNRAPAPTPPPAAASEPGVVSIDVSGLRLLTLSWDNQAAAQLPVLPACELLQWVTATLDGVLIESQYRVEGEPNPLAKLTLDLPDNLDLVGAESSQRKIALAPDGTGSEDKDAAVYSARFRLRRDSGLGKLMIPAPLPREAELKTRLAAISFEPTMPPTVASGQAAVALTPEEFLSEWGEHSQSRAPAQAVSFRDPAAEWVVSTAPPPDQLKLVDQRLRLLIGAEDVECRLQATLASRLAALYRIEVKAPAALRTSSVRLTADERVIPAEVSRSDAGRIVLLLKTPLPADSEVAIDLVGSIPTAGRPLVQLPIIGLQAFQALPLRVEVRRRPGVLVSLHDTSATLEDESAESQPTSSAGIHVASVRTALSDEPPGVTVRANDLSYNAVTVTHHRPPDAGIELDCRAIVEVSSGELSGLELRTPYVEGRLKLLAPESARLVELTAAGTARYRLDFSKPLVAGEKAVLAFSCVSPPNGDAQPAVLLGFPDARRLESWAAIPQGPASARERLSLKGLRRARNFHSELPAATHAAGWLLYRAPLPGRASVRWIGESRQQPGCALAFNDTFVNVNSDGGVSMLIRASIRPNGVDSCRLRLPEGFRLVGLSINGREPILNVESEDSCRVFFTHLTQAQQMHAMMVSSKPVEIGEQLVLPELVSVAGTRLLAAGKLVSTAGNAGLELRPPATSVPVEQAACDAMRLRQLFAGVPSQPGEVTPWWASRLADALRNLQQHEINWGGNPNAVTSSHSTPAAINFTETLLDDGIDYQPDALERLYFGAATDTPWRTVQAGLGSQPDGLLVVSRQPGGWPTRLVFLLLGAAGIASLWIMPDKQDVLRFVRSRRNTALALAGVAWWLWFPLSALGLAVLVIAALLEIRERHAHSGAVI